MKTIKNIIIRKAKLDDIPEITELWKELMDFHAERDYFFKRAANGHEKYAEYIERRIRDEAESLVLVAEYQENGSMNENSQLAGFINGRILDYPPVLQLKRYGEIVDIYVKPEFREAKLGKKLVEEMESFFKSKNIKRIQLTLAHNNEVSTKFWRKIGFSDFKETLFKEI